MPRAGKRSLAEATDGGDTAGGPAKRAKRAADAEDMEGDDANRLELEDDALPSDEESVSSDSSGSDDQVDEEAAGQDEEAEVVPKKRAAKAPAAKRAPAKRAPRKAAGGGASEELAQLQSKREALEAMGIDPDAGAGAVPDYDDGYGEDLMGDDADRAALAAMNALEREEELARRDEQRQTMSKTVQLKRMQLNEYLELEATLRRKGKLKGAGAGAGRGRGRGGKAGTKRGEKADAEEGKAGKRGGAKRGGAAARGRGRARATVDSDAEEEEDEEEEASASDSDSSASDAGSSASGSDSDGSGSGSSSSSSAASDSDEEDEEGGRKGKKGKKKAPVRKLRRAVTKKKGRARRGGDSDDSGSSGSDEEEAEDDEEAGSGRKRKATTAAEKFKAKEAERNRRVFGDASDEEDGGDEEYDIFGERRSGSRGGGSGVDVGAIGRKSKASDRRSGGRSSAAQGIGEYDAYGSDSDDEFADYDETSAELSKAAMLSRSAAGGGASASAASGDALMSPAGDTGEQAVPDVSKLSVSSALMSVIRGKQLADGAAELEDINSIRLSRRQAQRFLTHPQFAKLVRGTYVRVPKGLGQAVPSAASAGYRIARVVEVGHSGKFYDPFNKEDAAEAQNRGVLPSQMIRSTDYVLLIAIGSSTGVKLPNAQVEAKRTVRIKEISDHSITAAEWEEYKRRIGAQYAATQSDADKIPTKAVCAAKRAEAEEVMSTAAYDTRAVEKTLEAQDRSLMDRLTSIYNLAYVRANKEQELEKARAKLASLHGPGAKPEEVKSVSKHITSLETLLKAIDTEEARRRDLSKVRQVKRAEDKKGVSSLTRQVNVKLVERNRLRMEAASEDVRGKTNEEVDAETDGNPFERRRAAPMNMWKVKRVEGATGGAAAPAAAPAAAAAAPAAAAAGHSGNMDLTALEHLEEHHGHGGHGHGHGAHQERSPGLHAMDDVLGDHMGLAGLSLPPSMVRADSAESLPGGHGGHGGAAAAAAAAHAAVTSPPKKGISLADFRKRLASGAATAAAL